MQQNLTEAYERARAEERAAFEVLLGLSGKPGFTYARGVWEKAVAEADRARAALLHSLGMSAVPPAG